MDEFAKNGHDRHGKQRYAPRCRSCASATADKEKAREKQQRYRQTEHGQAVESEYEAGRADQRREVMREHMRAKRAAERAANPPAPRGRPRKPKASE